MWAMIPMFRTRSSAIEASLSLVLNVCPVSLALPAVVRKGLVGLRHPVDVVLAFERSALLVHRVHDLVGELVSHALLTPLARIRHEPAHGERAGATLRHLDGHLVVRTADAAALDLEHRRDRLDGALQHLERRLAGLGLDRLERLVDDQLGDRLLAVEHHLVDHLGDQLRVVDRVAEGHTGLNVCTTRHYEPFLAPYFERACLRSATPPVSSAARMIL